MALPSNAQLWDLWIKEQPTYQSRVSMGSKEVLTSRGFDAVERSSPGIMNDFVNAHVIWALNMVLPSRVRSWWRRNDCTETFFQPLGGMAQRLYGTTALEVEPGYLNLKSGDTRSPWITSYPDMDEDLFATNDNYQGLLTIRRNRIKEIVLSQYGIAETVGAMLMGLENSYTLHEDKVLDQCLYSMLTDTKLRSQQIVTVGNTAWNNKDNLIALFAQVGMVIEAMKSESTNAGWNMDGFETVQDISRLRLIVRPWLATGMKFYTNPGTFNPDFFNLGIPVISKANFGGISYAAAVDIGTVKAGSTLYPAYTPDELHTVVKAPAGHLGIGLAAIAGSTNPDEVIAYSGDANVKTVDPLPNTLAVLVDKGTIFSIIQNPYRVEPWGPNPRTLSINYWANADNNWRKYDRHFTCVRFDQEPASGS